MVFVTTVDTVLKKKTSWGAICKEENFFDCLIIDILRLSIFYQYFLSICSLKWIQISSNGPSGSKKEFIFGFNRNHFFSKKKALKLFFSVFVYYVWEKGMCKRFKARYRTVAHAFYKYPLWNACKMGQALRFASDAFSIRGNIARTYEIFVQEVDLPKFYSYPNTSKTCILIAKCLISFKKKTKEN